MAWEAAFELSEFIKVEQRAKTEDGTIWYLVSIQKDIADNITTKIRDYEQYYIDSYQKSFRNKSLRL
jgi:hypothetical protein